MHGFLVNDTGNGPSCPDRPDRPVSEQLSEMLAVGPSNTDILIRLVSSTKGISKPGWDGFPTRMTDRRAMVITYCWQPDKVWFMDRFRRNSVTKTTQQRSRSFAIFLSELSKRHQGIRIKIGASGLSTGILMHSFKHLSQTGPDAVFLHNSHTLITDALLAMDHSLVRKTKVFNFTQRRRRFLDSWAERTALKCGKSDRYVRNGFPFSHNNWTDIVAGSAEISTWLADLDYWTVQPDWARSGLEDHSAIKLVPPHRVA